MMRNVYLTSSIGLAMMAFSNHFKQYSKIIYFGDSLTDLNSSLSSDYVFATGKLHDYYIKNRMECVKFDDYNDMITKINEILF